MPAELGARVTAAMCARGRSFGEVRLSPDGATVAFVASSAGQTVLATVPAGGGVETVLTTEPEPRRGEGTFDWVPAGDALVYVGRDGALHHQPAAGGPARRLARTELASAPCVSPDGTRVAYVDDLRQVVVASLDPGGPWPVRLSGPADFCLDPSWSPDGSRLAWHTWDVPAMPWDDSHIAAASLTELAPAPAGPTRVPLPAPVAVGQPRFSPDGAWLGFVCDAGGWSNLWVVPLAGWDASGLPAACPLVVDDHEHAGPTWGPGQHSWVWSPDGRRVAFTRNEAGFGRLCLAEVASGEVEEVDQGIFSSLSWAGERLAALRSGARTPDQIVTYRTARGSPDPASRVSVVRGPVGGFEAAGLVEPEVVVWEGEARPAVGSVVHGRLLRAPERSPGLAPLIVWVHGGPTDQHRVRFNARAAFFLDRGWNILQVDPRGSTGWGRAYTQALMGEWGRLDVEDVAAGIREAARRCWGDPSRTVVMGGSSGGLVVLSVLGRHPELCAAGVDLYGVTDLVSLDETTHRYEAHYQARLLGPLPGEAARYRDRSPVTFAASIAAPLLVLHGTEDQTVPPGQSESLVAAVRAAGGTVEHHRFSGEGHGWSRPESVLRELEVVEGFLDRYVLRGPGLAGMGRSGP